MQHRGLTEYSRRMQRVDDFDIPSDLAVEEIVADEDASDRPRDRRRGQKSCTSLVAAAFLRHELG